MNKYGIETVPQLTTILYNKEEVEKFVDGDTTIGKAKCREGIVIKTVKERRDPRYGRACLKLVSNKYLEIT